MLNILVIFVKTFQVVFLIYVKTLGNNVFQ